MSDEDEDFDVDFVSNASRKVKAKWSKTALTKSPKKPKEKQEEEQRPAVAVTPCSPVRAARGLGAGSRVAVSASPGSDSDVSLTPPASPTGTTPSPAPTPKGRAVRGANRTNKTKKALAKLKKNVAGERGATRAKMSRREMSMDGSLLVEEGGAVSSGGEEESMEVKVRWRTEVVRVTAARDELAGQFIDRLAVMFSLPRGGVILYLPDSSEGIDREETLGGLNITVATVLQARPRIDMEQEKDDLIELRLQTKDRRSPPVLLKIRSTDKMGLVVEQYVEKTGVARDKLKFFFDGEELDEEETAKDMDMEGGECIDVHISS